VLVAGFWLRDWFSSRLFKVEQTCVRCRERGNKLVQLNLVRDARTGEPIGVQACTGWRKRGEVACCKQCLPLFNPKSA